MEPINLRIAEKKTDVRPVLESALERADNTDGVILIELHGSAPAIYSSRLSTVDLTFLSAFFNAFMYQKLASHAFEPEDSA